MLLLRRLLLLRNLLRRLRGQLENDEVRHRSRRWTSVSPRDIEYGCRPRVRPVRVRSIRIHVRLAVGFSGIFAASEERTSGCVGFVLGGEGNRRPVCSHIHAQPQLPRRLVQ